jgi:hypothetical protein
MPLGWLLKNKHTTDRREPHLKHGSGSRSIRYLHPENQINLLLIRIFAA